MSVHIYQTSRGRGRLRVLVYGAPRDVEHLKGTAPYAGQITDVDTRLGELAPQLETQLNAVVGIKQVQLIDTESNPEGGSVGCGFDIELIEERHRDSVRGALARLLCEALGVTAEAFEYWTYV